MHSYACVFIQQVADFLLLVGGVVVHDQPVVSRRSLAQPYPSTLWFTAAHDSPG
jgi:hypothetical protein